MEKTSENEKVVDEACGMIETSLHSGDKTQLFSEHDFPLPDYSQRD